MKHEYFDEVTKESVPHKEGLQDLLEYLKEHEIPAVVRHPQKESVLAG